jgi:predicted Zn-dependent protease
MLTRDQALTICETVLAQAKAAGAEDAAVSLDNSIETHARFADNRITTSGRAEDLDITATVWVGQRRGATTGNDSRADALERLAREAVQIARVSPVHREYVPTLGPFTYPEPRGFAAATADVDLNARAQGLQAALAACRTAKVTGAGFHTASAAATAAATLNGNRRYFR